MNKGGTPGSLSRLSDQHLICVQVTISHIIMSLSPVSGSACWQCGAWLGFSLFPSFSASPPLTRSLSLSLKTRKLKKKMFLNEQRIWKDVQHHQIIRKMQIKPRITYYFTTTRTAIIKKTIKSNVRMPKKGNPLTLLVGL